MTYNKTVWEDRIVQFPNRYKDQNDNQYTFTRDSGVVTSEGTQMSAEKMNNIENGIAGLAEEMESVQNNVTDTGWIEYIGEIAPNYNIDLYGTDTPIRYRKIGNIVEFAGFLRNTSTISSIPISGIDLFTLPEGYRPTTSRYFICPVDSQRTDNWVLFINYLGQVKLMAYNDNSSFAPSSSMPANSEIPFNVMFMVG